MARYELSVSPTYVKSWTYKEGIREILQNALDQESINGENKMSYDYHQDTKTLLISSKSSKLEKSSLLFGVSSKSNDDTTIGQFGEGYKLALLVLLREGHEVIIHNYQAKEKWVPKFIKSKRYDSELLVIDIYKFIFKAVPDADLTFEIRGISVSQYEEIISNTLHMQSDFSILDSTNGSILLDERHANKIFVNGLFVCESTEELVYGYDFKPSSLKLDRDRLAVDAFDLKWKTSIIWSEHTSNILITELVFNNANDVKFIDSHGITNILGDNVYDTFTKVHGISAIPVATGSDIARLKAKYPKLIPIVVPEIQHKSIQRSQAYKAVLAINETTETKLKSPEEILQDFYNQYHTQFDIDCDTDLTHTISLSRNWFRT